MPFSWDTGAERYAETPIRNPEAYEAGLARVRAHLAPDMRLLEMGCGTGSTARRLAPGVAHVHGTDASPAMITIARRNAAAEGPANVSFEEAALGGPALEGEPFDAVAAFNLLHLADDLDAALADLASRVRPGGLALTKTPCLASWIFLKPVIGALRLFGKAPKVAYFSRARLEAAFRAAGFDVLETGDYPARPPSRLVIARRT